MKTLKEYISKNIVVCDIDDTIITANPNVMSIYKKLNDGSEIKMTTKEFAEDPDAENAEYDYRDFRNPKKIYDSIIKGTPILKNLRIMDKYINAGYDFSFLTARSHEDIVAKALQKILRTRKTNGKLVKLGNTFNRSMSHAVSDDTKNYEGNSAAEKKANILIKLCKKYDNVVFIDDDIKNINCAKQLNLKNLKIIKA